MGSWWEGTRINKNADYNINPYALPEIVEMLYRNSVIYPLDNYVDVINFKERQYKRILYQLEVLKKIPDINKPTFVFAHFLITHPPYVFDKNGNLLKRPSGSKSEEREDYILQVMNANR